MNNTQKEEFAFRSVWPEPDSGFPKEIADVQENRNVDLSPFVTHAFTCAGRVFKFEPSLSLVPDFDETRHYLCLQDDRLGIDVFAATRERVRVELQEQLAVLWEEYALAAEDTLSPAALTIKRNLQSAIQEQEFGGLPAIASRI